MFASVSPFTIYFFPDYNSSMCYLWLQICIWEIPKKYNEESKNYPPPAIMFLSSVCVYLPYTCTYKHTAHIMEPYCFHDW